MQEPICLLPCRRLSPLGRWHPGGRIECAPGPGETDVHGQDEFPLVPPALYLLGSATHSGAAFLGGQRWARKSTGMETLALSLSGGKSFMLSVTIESALPCSAHTQKALS